MLLGYCAYYHRMYARIKHQFHELVSVQLHALQVNESRENVLVRADLERICSKI